MSLVLGIGKRGPVFLCSSAWSIPNQTKGRASRPSQSRLRRFSPPLRHSRHGTATAAAAKNGHSHCNHQRIYEHAQPPVVNGITRHRCRCQHRHAHRQGLSRGTSPAGVDDQTDQPRRSMTFIASNERGCGPPRMDVPRRTPPQESPAVPASAPHLSVKRHRMSTRARGNQAEPTRRRRRPVVPMLMGGTSRKSTRRCRSGDRIRADWQYQKCRGSQGADRGACPGWGGVRYRPGSGDKRHARAERSTRSGQRRRIARRQCGRSPHWTIRSRPGLEAPNPVVT